MDTGLTAADVKEALRRRHPAYEADLKGVGRWTCIEEWENIDLLALDAWRSADVVGYEVKISRADMRNELLKPKKRRAAVAMCTRFYFAVPAGMLTEEERAFVQPDWSDGDFRRQRCSGVPEFGLANRYADRRGERKYGGQCHGQWRSRRKVVQPYTVRMPVPTTLPARRPLGTAEEQDLKLYLERLARERDRQLERMGSALVPCPACKGKGYATRSRVEIEAPTLWVPPDVGLIVVNAKGCTVLKQAPKNKVPEPILPWPYVAGHSKRLDEENSARVQRQAINVLVRWVSARPDPRHR